MVLNPKKNKNLIQTLISSDIGPQYYFFFQNFFNI